MVRGLCKYGCFSQLQVAWYALKWAAENWGSLQVQPEPLHQVLLSKGVFCRRTSERNPLIPITLSHQEFSFKYRREDELSNDLGMGTAGRLLTPCLGEMTTWDSSAPSRRHSHGGSTHTIVPMCPVFKPS